MNKHEPGVGDNVISRSELKGFVDRIESVNGEIAELQDDVKEIKKEAKGKGYDLKIIDWVIKQRKIDPRVREVEQEMREAYMIALGMME
jgi:uncharacterized protein (UPF0335 family)